MPNQGMLMRYDYGHAADIAQGLERLTVAQEVVGSRPIIRPIKPLVLLQIFEHGVKRALSCKELCAKNRFTFYCKRCVRR